MTLDQLVRVLLALIQRFFAWWGAELASLIPARLRVETGWARDERVLLLGDREAVLGRDRADGRFEATMRLPLAGALGRSGHRADPVRLRLPASAALRIELPLPSAALENLSEAVSFQLDRYTPFLPDQVYLVCTAGERQGERVAVAATVVERRAVQDAVRQVQSMGFAVTRVEVAGGAGRERQPDPLPVLELRSRSWGQFALTSACAVLVLALGAAAITLPFRREQAHADALQHEMAAARARAETAQKLQQANEAATREANFLTDRKRDRPSALEIMLELTRLTPDDTYLSSAQLSGSELRIIGISDSASGLIGRFEKSTLFHKAEFQSPVTPDQATGREHFVISVQVGNGKTP
jgi:general secretion pathway protein L